MQAEPTPDDDLFALFVFLVSSARGAPQEGRYTASLRLIDAAGRLAKLSAAGRTDAFVARVGERIRSEAANQYMQSTDGYLGFLDDVLRATSREVLRRNGLVVAPDTEENTTPGTTATDPL